MAPARVINSPEDPMSTLSDRLTTYLPAEAQEATMTIVPATSFTHLLDTYEQVLDDLVAEAQAPVDYDSLAENVKVKVLRAMVAETEIGRAHV